ncbi:hypothetical protein ACFFRR_003996 [Megaselia abdita]
MMSQNYLKYFQNDIKKILMLLFNDFEFSAVKLVKHIFISRLPPEIQIDVLRRVRTCNLEITILQGKRNPKYASVLISVGRDDNAFNLINSQGFWQDVLERHPHLTEISLLEEKELSQEETTKFLSSFNSHNFQGDLKEVQHSDLLPELRP